MTQLSTTNESPWPHRLAVLLVATTFPLIWVGGLVTTYDAGMAVPDWPSTYGYNLFVYPWQTWLFGPWDLFIEHGHRLLGALVGFITIALVWSVWRHDRRAWVRVASWVALGLVILQGGLGGARVLLDDRQLAMVHGCVGPAFFAYCMFLAVVTSHTWKSSANRQNHPASRSLHRVALFTTLLAYLQLVIGAQLRHVSVMATPGVFRVAVIFHLLVAAVITIHVIQLLVMIKRQHVEVGPLRLPVNCLAALILVQLTLGIATWVTKYGWPDLVSQYQFAAAYTVQAKSLWQAMIVTAHVATGSLILATSVMLSVRSLRLVRLPSLAVGSSALAWELAT